MKRKTLKMKYRITEGVEIFWIWNFEVDVENRSISPKLRTNFLSDWNIPEAFDILYCKKKPVLDSWKALQRIYDYIFFKKKKTTEVPIVLGPRSYFTT